MSIFLELLEKPLDPNQRNCCTVQTNAVIKAGAGSGKTQVFSNRFSYLIIRDENPLKINEILTLTFTNKAAAEMYQRIYKSLKFFASQSASSKITESQINKAQEALKSFSYSHIQTLDSYCCELVRKNANTLGIPQDFTVGSKENNNTLEQQALSFVLKHKNDMGLQRFLKPGGYETFSSEIAQIISTCTSIATECGFFSKCFKHQLEIINSDGNFTIEELIDEALSIEKPSATIISAMKNYKTTSKNKWEWLFNVASKTKSGSVEFKDFFDTNFKSKKDLAKAAADFIEEKEYLEKFFELLDKFLEETNRKKRITGSLSFKDVSDLALYLLKTDSRVQHEETSRFKQIMIDEFQDNNIDNRDLLLLLCGVPAPILENPESICNFLKTNAPDKLFFVGDEKQSIYRFRNADVKVFNSLEQITGQKTDNFFMSYNYRSAPELVSSFNLLFGGMEQNRKGLKHPSLLPDKSVGYEAGFPETAFIMKNGQDNPALTDENCKIDIFLLDKEKPDDPNINDKEEQIAFAVAKEIKTIHDAKNVSYSSMAVLDKNRDTRSVLCRYLSKFGIPYSLDEEKELFSDGPVNDIFAVLKLLEDRNNLQMMGVFLCSPFVGMEPNSAINCLNKIRQNRKFADTNFDYANTLLDEIEKEKTNGILSILYNLWFKYGYVYSIRENQITSGFQKQFDILFELARQAQASGKDISWFLHQLEKRKTKEESLLSCMQDDSSELDVENAKCPVEQTDSIQIMTIHKSKGLEFDYVFALDCLGKAKAASCKNFFFSNTSGISVKLPEGTNYFFEKEKENQNNEIKAEYLRLIYVAMTRASKRLFLFGERNQKSPWNKIFDYYSDNTNIVPFRLRNIEWKDLKKEKIDLKLDSNFLEETWTVKQDFEAKPVRRISPSSLEATDSNEVHKVNTETPYSEINRIIQSCESFTFKDFGTLAHKVMENTVTNTDNLTYDWNELEFSIDSKKLEKLIAIAIDMSEIFKKSSFFRDVENSDFVKTEWAFRAYKMNHFINGVIDLLYRKPDGSYVIIDYKTDGDLESRGKYLKQQKLYRIVALDLIKSVTGQTVKENDISCFLFYLRYGKALDITEACNNIQITEEDFV